MVLAGDSLHPCSDYTDGGILSAPQNALCRGRQRSATIRPNPEQIGDQNRPKAFVVIREFS